MNATKITVQSLVHAPIQTVWRTWTEPEHIMKWNFASDDWHCPRVTNDLRIGGTYSARMEARDGSFGFDFITVYDEIIPYQKITYTMEDGRQATTTFVKKDEGGTEVTTVFDAEQENSLEMQQGGWQAILDNFKKYAESQPKPRFDFIVNKADNTIRIIREFDANLTMVWRAWTEPELLAEWWAPKPYHIETKSLDLRVGGMWLYTMVSPENEKTWCKADYTAVEIDQLLSWLDAFCDENGVENTMKPRSLWTNSFSENNGITTVNTILKHDKLEDIEMMIEMGFKEGFTMALGNLDESLSKNVLGS